MNEEQVLDIFSYEMEHPELAEVPQTFYQDIEDFLKNMEASINEDYLNWKKYNNFVSIVKRIKMKRLEKILLAALNNVKLKHMLPEEEILYEKVNDLLNQFRNLAKQEIHQVEEKSIEEKNEEDKKLLKIRITSKVDAYYGLDGNKYGPYEIGQVVELPEQEAKWLVESEFAEYIEE